jgi:hypothetical protein
MSKALYESANRMLLARLRWEQKQRTFYTMRHDGLPRTNKPFPSAADGHVAVIDNAIRKNKPFLVGQLTSGNRLCQFVSLKQQVEALSDAAADFYDFLTFNRSTLMDEMDCVFDTCYLRGRGVIKCTVDPLDDYALKDEAIDPLFILMPQEADDFEDADEFVHVRQFTVAKYMRLDQRWKKDDVTIQKIRGQPAANINVIIQQKRLQEGINYTSNTEQILVWEHWKKTQGGHTVSYYSPLSPEIELRQPHGNPFKTGGKESVPFFSFPMEKKDKGWYAVRGLGELLAPDEQFATKIVNEWADYMTFSNRPIYSGDKEITNAANYRWQPGEYIPGNIHSVQQSAPPMSFSEMLMLSRGMAEEKAQSPDFGITSSEGQNTNGGKPRTATENDRIAALQQTGGNYQASIQRRVLARMHRHRWGLIVQFKQRDFAYYAAGQIGTLPEQALHDQYLITPDGSPEGWNPVLKFQKAMAALQAFAGNPNVDMEVLTQAALNAYDGRIALKAFTPTNMKGASEYEDQAMEILLLNAMPPFPVTVDPKQDQPSRIKCIIDWMHAAGKLGVPVNPLGKQRVHQNLVQRLQILKQQNPAAAKQIEQQLMQMEQQPMGGAPPQQNGQPPVNGNGAPPTATGTEDAASKESLSINYKDAPEDIKRQMESKAGFVPSKLPPKPEPVKLPPARP